MILHCGKLQISVHILSLNLIKIIYLSLTASEVSGAFKIQLFLLLPGWMVDPITSSQVCSGQLILGYEA